MAVNPKKLLSDFVFYRTYAETLPNGRKETWEQTVERVRNMHAKRYPAITKQIDEAFSLVEEKLLIPSARSLQFAGRAIEVCHPRLYNCSALALDSFDSFKELCYLLMSGCGVGYSVYATDLAKLPSILASYDAGPYEIYEIPDTKEGWAISIKKLLKNPRITFGYDLIRPEGAPISTGGYASGAAPLKRTHEKIRSILFKAGGRKLKSSEASDIACHIADMVIVGSVRRSAMICLYDFKDPEMQDYKEFGFDIENPQRHRVNITEALPRDLSFRQFGKVFYNMVTGEMGEPGFRWGGGLTNPCCRWDTQVLTSNGPELICNLVGKSVYIWDGQAWVECSSFRVTGENQPILKIELLGLSSIFVTPYHTMILSTGERIEARQLKVGDLLKTEFGTQPPAEVLSITNAGTEEKVFCCTVPTTNSFTLANGVLVGNCGEIALNPMQFCNLTSINLPKSMKERRLHKAAEAAAFIGTLQAGYTDFPFLRKEWEETTSREALLGVSLCGLGAVPKGIIPYADDLVQILKETNEKAADAIGINHAARIGTVKPEGSTSIIFGTSPGIHATFARFYLRRIRVDRNSPIGKLLMKTLGAPFPAETGEVLEVDKFQQSQLVLCVPIEEEPDSLFVNDESAIQFLKRVRYVNKEWIKPTHQSGEQMHNVSATVYYKEEELEKLRRWLYDNRECYTALSFIQASTKVYPQMPYEEITEEEFNNWQARVEVLSLLKLEELDWSGIEDERKQEFACAGGACEVR